MTTLHGATTHHGQHDPDKCFACKLKSLNFSTGGPAAHGTKKDRWSKDPVVERINELHKTAIDTDAMNKKLRDSGVSA